MKKLPHLILLMEKLCFFVLGILVPYTIIAFILFLITLTQAFLDKIVSFMDDIATTVDKISISKPLDLGDIATAFGVLVSFFGVVVALCGLYNVWKQLETQNEQLKMDTLLKAIEPFKSDVPDRRDIQVGLSMLKSITRKEEPKKDEVNYSITMARFFVQHLKLLNYNWKKYYEFHPRDLYEIGFTVLLVAKKRDKCDKNNSLFYAFKEFYDAYKIVMSEYLSLDIYKKYSDLLCDLCSITKDIDDELDEKYFPKLES